MRADSPRNTWRATTARHSTFPYPCTAATAWDCMSHGVADHREWVEYAMTKEQSTEFLATFPKPIQWMRPLLLRRYDKGCRVLGVDPALPSHPSNQPCGLPRWGRAHPR